MRTKLFIGALILAVLVLAAGGFLLGVRPNPRAA